LISGAPLGTTAEGDEGMQWSGMYDEEVVVGWCVCETRGGELDLNQKKNTKPSCCGSVSGAPCEMAMENDA
jgi:hypothetical protein